MNQPVLPSPLNLLYFLFLYLYSPQNTVVQANKTGTSKNTTNEKEKITTVPLYTCKVSVTLNSLTILWRNRNACRPMYFHVVRFLSAGVLERVNIEHSAGAL